MITPNTWYELHIFDTSIYQPQAFFIARSIHRTTRNFQGICTFLLPCKWCPRTSIAEIEDIRSLFALVCMNKNACATIEIRNSHWLMYTYMTIRTQPKRGTSLYRKLTSARLLLAWCGVKRRRIHARAYCGCTTSWESWRRRNLSRLAAAARKPWEHCSTVTKGWAAASGPEQVPEV
jgi:hypothetical protein